MERPYEEQRRLKLQILRDHWTTAGLDNASLPDPTFVAIAGGGLRDRVDLVIDTRSGDWCLGLFDRDHKVIVDLPLCPQLSPALQDWLSSFRRRRLDVERGSVRLRVAPDGRKGVWLDFANVDIKRFLDDQSILKDLMSEAQVEMGQKRKVVGERDRQIKLLDPQLAPWFETYIGLEEQSVPLYCSIGSFTQPGFQANRALIRTLMHEARSSGARRIVEFGSGIGNFTLPLADIAEHVTACEIDELACLALGRSLSETELMDRVDIRRGNFHSSKNRSFPDLSTYDTIVVDPPRSGLRDFLLPLEEANRRPPYFLYVSCFAESFVQDSVRLLHMGYGLKRLTIVDQFPQSPHFEMVATFSL